jgi:hypothetical protein
VPAAAGCNGSAVPAAVAGCAMPAAVVPGAVGWC